MKTPQHENMLRRYLLGDLPEAEQRSVEVSFLQDPDYRESLLIVEDELIDDYLDGLLSQQESRRFAVYFLAAPLQQQKVNTARSVKKAAVDRLRRNQLKKRNRSRKQTAS